MNRHSRILQLRIQASAIDRNEIQTLERVRAKADRGEKEDENESKRARDVRHQLAIVGAIGQQRNRRVNRENQRPEEQRAGLATPERGDRIDLGQVRAGVRRDVLDREIVRQQRRPQAERRQHHHRQRGIDRPLAALDQIVSAQLAAGKRDGGRPGRHE